MYVRIELLGVERVDLRVTVFEVNFYELDDDWLRIAVPQFVLDVSQFFLQLYLLTKSR